MVKVLRVTYFLYLFPPPPPARPLPLSVDLPYHRERHDIVCGVVDLRLLPLRATEWLIARASCVGVYKLVVKVLAHCDCDTPRQPEDGLAALPLYANSVRLIHTLITIALAH